MNLLSYTKITIVFVIMQVFVIIRNLTLDFFSFFWYCDFIPGLLVLAFFARNIQAVKGILNVGLFAQLGYIIVVLFKAIFGETLFGFVFNFPFTIQYVVPTLIIHVSALIAFLATYKEKPTKISLYYSLALLVGIYILVLSFVKPDGMELHNYNFIFKSNLLDGLPYYTYLWVPLAFIFVVLPTHFFQHVVYRFYKRNTKA